MFTGYVSQCISKNTNVFKQPFDSSFISLPTEKAIDKEGRYTYDVSIKMKKPKKQAENN